LLRDNFGIPYLLGVVIILAAIGFLAFKGSGMIGKFLSSVSMLSMRECSQPFRQKARNSPDEQDLLSL